MGLTNFPHGVTSFGVPVIGASIPQTAQGQAWFVDAVNGTSGGGAQHGGAPDSAFATIQAAVNAASAGDTIFVFPGSYTENVVVTTDYLTICGALEGRYGWPDLVPDSGLPLAVTSAQGFVGRRLRLAATGADCCVQRGNGFTYEDCVFDGDGTAAKAGLRLLPSDTDDSYTASEGFIRRNVFRGNANGIIFDTGAAPAVGVGSTDNLIEGNRFYANTLDLATADTGGGVYSVQTTDILHNTFEDKNKTTYIDLTTTNGGAAGDQTGAINGNVFASDTITTTKIKMVGTGFTFAGNFSTVGVVDGSGLD